MRGISRLLALLFLVLLVATGAVYYYQRLAAEANATAPPAKLPPHLRGTADRWQWAHTVDGKPVVQVSAREYRMVESPSRVELEDVELRIFGQNQDQYDRVRSKRADVDTQSRTMYSDGEVEITMHVPSNGDPMPERPLVIRSSKVHFETDTGIARTEQPAFFEFAEGFGESVGAVYNPQTKQVHLLQDVVFHFSQDHDAENATRVSASSALYLEGESRIDLQGPTQLCRDTLQIDAGDAKLHLTEGTIRAIHAREVRGRDQEPGRKLAFGGDQVDLNYRADGSLHEIVSHTGSYLDSESPTALTKARSRFMHLFFREGTEDPILEKSFSRGAARLESIPAGEAASRQGRRMLESEEIEVQMRPSGSEADVLLTHAPGVLQFFPASDEDRHRTLRAERMTMRYGDANRLQHFRAASTTTESQPAIASVKKARVAKQPAPAPLRTWAKDLEAEFVPETGEMAWMRQWGNFRFEEGLRKGIAHSAMLHQKEDYQLLEQNARVWDEGGSLQADRIRIQQPSGELLAEGSVVSTQMPEEKPKEGEARLPGGQQALLATAAKMTTRNQNQWIRYEGNVHLWQGANRLHSRVATIDREKQTLEAEGEVFSQIEEAAPEGAGELAKPTYTLVHSNHLLYREEGKLATYTGKVRMRRSGLSVDSASLRMVLAEDKDGQTQLDKSFADGDVRILMREAETVRRGGSEHAEYYPDLAKMVLYGGEPFFEDQQQGATRGKRLTYFSNEDRLIVESGNADSRGSDESQSEPTRSRFRRNK
jgi:LPS export ABC transporter protein LptC